MRWARWLGKGICLPRVAAAILTTTLLAWKVELHRFAGGLQPAEIRSAVLLGLLGLATSYPVLPNRFVHSMAFNQPRWEALASRSLLSPGLDS